MKYSGHVQMVGDHRADPEYAEGDYVFHLAWECFGIPHEELENMAEEIVGCSLFLWSLRR